MISSLLIANRGEIAARVARTARRLGVRVICVHSTADADSAWLDLADEAIEIGPPPAPQSYLSIEAILDAARRTGAEAIHPGYGFLSENAAFADAIAAEGRIFVGPPADAIRAMGSKSEAKALMEKAGIPLLPGYHGQDQADDRLAGEAARIGYPVMLKAAAGGGGKGMRVVESADGFAEALAGAKREARAAFGDDRFLIEKFLPAPRHVEVQVFADSQGNAIHLYERDCSVQRRHQKVIEEAPAPGLSAELRQEMGRAAVEAARAIGYVGAGTVEFLYDGDGSFYFMEMNTRLQVEHPVTEAITGLDLVEWQLRVAAGEALPLAQEAIPLNGHAIEARLYAEAPERGFLPSTGRLDTCALPAEGGGLRIDSGVRAGDRVTPHYDPMLAKVIAWGETREVARTKLKRALDDSLIVGVRTNLRFLSHLLGHEAFAAAELSTRFIEAHSEALLPAIGATPRTHALIAALWHLLSMEGAATKKPSSPWAASNGFRLNLPADIRLRLQIDGEAANWRAEPSGSGWRLDTGEEVHALAGRLAADGRIEARIDGRRLLARAASIEAGVRVLADGVEHDIFLADLIADESTDTAAEGSLVAPMPGTLLDLKIAEGTHVAAGTVLLVLEAMKMEHAVRAPRAGTVKAFRFAPGERVGEGDLMVDFEADPD